MTAAQFSVATRRLPDLVEHVRSMADAVAVAHQYVSLTYTHQFEDVRTGRVLWLMTEGVN